MLLIVITLLVLVLGTSIAAVHVLHSVQERKARSALHTIQLYVERYAVDNDGSYPATLADALPDGLPENPYTGKPLVVQEPGDAPLPGGVVYVAVGPMVARPGEDWQPVTSAAGAAETGPLFSPEFDQYVLLVYGARDTSRYLSKLNPVGFLPPGISAGIDWSRVCGTLSAGFDYRAGSQTSTCPSQVPLNR